MSLFSGIKALFSAPKALDIAEKGVDALYAGLDAAIYTPEEKAEMAVRIGKSAIEMVKATVDENSKRSVTRRIMAIMIMGPFVSLITLSAFIWKLDPLWAKYMLDSAMVMSNLALAVGIFYFGYYGVKQITKKREKA